MLLLSVGATPPENASPNHRITADFLTAQFVPQSL